MISLESRESQTPAPFIAAKTIRGMMQLGMAKAKAPPPGPQAKSTEKDMSRGWQTQICMMMDMTTDIMDEDPAILKTLTI